MGEDVAATIVGLERAALERWAKGDPSGFLEISAPQVTYFDPMLEKRLDGHAALSALYETARGQIRLAGFDLVNPRVEAAGDLAVLSFNFVSWGDDGVPGPMSRWNCSEVYRRIDGRWLIVHTHWSLTKPDLKQ